MSALAFTIVALILVGPVPVALAKASWPMRAPRAAIVLWQSIALAAVLSAFSAGIAIASRLFVPGPDGRPTATITSELAVLGWPLWTLYVVVFALTLVIGARLAVAVLQVAVATRRRRSHHRMLVDLLGVSHDSAPEACTRARDYLPLTGDGLRILDVSQPLAYCLPGVRSRVVVSEGTLTTLSDGELSAILSHERAHLRARHDLVLEMFTAMHAAFPRFVRSASALDAVRLLIELLADLLPLRQLFAGRHIHHMHDQRVEIGPPLGAIDRRHRPRIIGPGGEAINRLGRHRDDLSGAQPGSGFSNGLRIGRQDLGVCAHGCPR